MSDFRLPMVWGSPDDGGQGEIEVIPVQSWPMGQPGRLLRPASPLARQLGEILSDSGAVLSDRSLVRIVANDGSAVSFDRLSRAVGGVGGRRGFIRGPRTIEQNVRLVRPSAARAISPALPFAAATVALDMVAQQQQMKLLEEIAATTHAIREAQIQEEIASLRAAQQAIEEAAAKVYDRGVLGPENGVDSAVQASRVAFERSLIRLGTLEAILEDVGGTVSATRMRKTLEKHHIDGFQGTAELITNVRLSCQVRAQSIVLQQALAESVPEQGAFLPLLQSRLGSVEGAVDRLAAIEDWFAGLQIKARNLGVVFDRWDVEEDLRTQRFLGQFAGQLEQRRSMPALPPAVSASPDGSFTITALMEEGRLLLPTPARDASEPD